MKSIFIDVIDQPMLTSNCMFFTNTYYIFRLALASNPGMLVYTQCIAVIGIYINKYLCISINLNVLSSSYLPY